MTLESVPEGTLYRAHVLHGDEEVQQKHAEMGFQQGWGTCAAQLEEVAQSLRS
jgi:uncharacterized protein YndB with AHSA1/START domain